MMKSILYMILSGALVLTGCSPVPGGASAQGSVPAPEPVVRALSQPVYPEFPTLPQFQDNGEDYWKQTEQYYEAVEQIRGSKLVPELLQSLNEFAGASTALALDGQKGKNAIYSPVSLWAALAMAAQCAEGDSRTQVLNALGAESVEDLQEQVSQVWRRLYTENGTSSLLLANSIWLDSGKPGNYVQETLDTLAEQYFAGTYCVPMGTAEADKAVTEWISQQTNGLIGSGDPVVETDALTLALLVSTLYYRAGWKDAFQPEQTWQDDFTNGQGQTAQTAFMHRTASGNWCTAEGYQAAALSTDLGEMVFVLPDEGTAPESLLQDSDFLGKLEFDRFGPVEWSVPKFDVNSDLDLMETLHKLGVTDLLSPGKADLSALTDLEASLSDAKQLARVKVDEEGVEAAAATILSFKLTGATIEDPEVCVMDLDRPFLFVIRTENIPLFVGVVNQV